MKNLKKPQNLRLPGVLLYKTPYIIECMGSYST